MPAQRAGILIQREDRKEEKEKNLLQCYAQHRRRSLTPLTMPQPGHCLDDQHSRIDRLDKTLIRTLLVRLDNFIHGVGIDQHQDGSTGCETKTVQQKSSIRLG